MAENIKNLTMDLPATYQIKVPGEFSELWSDFGDKLEIRIERPGERTSITTLTGSVDQAALVNLLNQLYSRGLPLISVFCIEASGEE